MGIEELWDLAAGELQLREAYSTPALGRLDRRREGSDGIPGIPRVENRVVVVFQIVPIDGDVSEADQSDTTIGEL